MSATEPAFWLNILGLSAGMAGTLLVYFFGVPRQIDMQGAEIIVTERVIQEDIDKTTRYKKLGNTGLGLLFLSFVLQFCSAILLKYPSFIGLTN